MYNKVTVNLFLIKLFVSKMHGNEMEGGATHLIPKMLKWIFLKQTCFMFSALEIRFLIEILT